MWNSLSDVCLISKNAKEQPLGGGTAVDVRCRKKRDPIGRPETMDGNAGEFHGSPSGLPAMPALRLKVRATDRAGREVSADPVTVSVAKRQCYPRMPEAEAAGAAPCTEVSRRFLTTSR